MVVLSCGHRRASSDGRRSATSPSWPCRHSPSPTRSQYLLFAVLGLLAGRGRRRLHPRALRRRGRLRLGLAGAGVAAPGRRRPAARGAAAGAAADVRRRATRCWATASRAATRVGFLLLLLVGKMVATSLTIGIGGSGGVFAPSLFIGAMLGAASATAVHQLAARHSPAPPAPTR